ncbi:MAG: zinc ribbon domain-containing protein [Anaerolineae bacterium]
MPQLPDLTALLASLSRILGLFTAFLGAYLLALSVSMIIWTFRDIRSRSRDIFAQVLAVVLVIVFNIAGLLLYFILRPRETLSEKYERELAGEAMLQEIEERQVCPVCHHKIVAEYLVCPNCHTKLHKKCEHCGRVLNLKWNVCPYCAVPQAVPAAPKAVETPPPPPTWKRETAPPPKAQPVATAAAMPRAVTPPPDGKPESAPEPAPLANPLAPPEAS